MNDVGLVSPALELVGVRHRYGKRIALDAVSFTCNRGVTALVGPNGAGKSTLLGLVATSLRLQHGSLQIGGVPLGGRASTQRELRRQIGLLPQQFGFYPRLTVYEGMEYAAWLRKYRSADLGIRIREVLALVDLEAATQRRLGDLSGGLRKRFGIAQAMIHEPSLLLLDEPTGDLDPEQRIRLRRLVMELGGHTAVLMSTHLIEDVVQVSDDVRVLAGGRLRFTGSLSAFCGATAPGEPVSVAAAEQSYLQLVRPE